MKKRFSDEPGHSAVLRVARRWRIITSELTTCRLDYHPKGNCKSVLSEGIELSIT